jgi:hypothetical protein
MVDEILEFNRQSCHTGRTQVLEIRSLGDDASHRYKCVLSSPEELFYPVLTFPAKIRQEESRGRHVLEISFESRLPMNRIIFLLGRDDQPIECTLETDEEADPTKVYCGPGKDHPQEMPFRADLLPTGFRKPEIDPPGPGWGVWMARRYYQIPGEPEREVLRFDDEGIHNLRAMNYLGS